MRGLSLLAAGAAWVLVGVSCASGSKGFDNGDDGGGQGDDSGLFGDGSLDGSSSHGGDPQTCADAASSHSYVGCDYWPTVVANNVWSVFDFAVVVANGGQSSASVTVTGPSGTNQTTTVAPDTLEKIYLPWVTALKGQDWDPCAMTSPGLTASVLQAKGAYHLLSDKPVTVYQFNALEYKGQGGPSGKSWSSCPGSQTCPLGGPPIGCYSFTNDASLLLPSTAMTGNYRVTGHGGEAIGAMGAYFAITGTQDNTTVSVKVSSTGEILAGTGVTATAAGGTLMLTLNAGDVAELVGGPTDASDLSGSLVQASAPVEVITGIPCTNIPSTASACDHLEESVFPAETLGKDYVVATPAGPNGNAVGQQVRIYGNFDGTNLTYAPSAPGTCPTTISAGQVVDCGIVSEDFEVKGDHPFAVGQFTLGASIVDPSSQPPLQKGDPAESMATAVEQYRTKYVFLAPDDYDVNYVMITAPSGTGLTLDGQPVTSAPTAVGAYSAYRVLLGAGQSGSHLLTSTNAVGIQVVGYGSYTSYMYPGGLNLAQIAPPPPK